MLAAIGLAALVQRPASATTAEFYNPSWAHELAWTNDTLFNTPLGSRAWLENLHDPWWQTQVAHPIGDYSGSKLAVGAVRLDTALITELTIHRLLQGWNVAQSPTRINNIYTFTPRGTQHEARTARGSQNAYLNFGFHPISTISGDVGAELQGNYDQRFWFPLNDEHRQYNNDRRAKIVRGELKYEDDSILLRGFEGTPNYSWIYQNDLFALLPTQMDVEYYRRSEGSETPRGGEARFKTPLGNLNVLGGTEPKYTYGSSLYAKYDTPTYGSWENTFVYRNEQIPFGSANERRWTASYNTSFSPVENLQSHLGVLYQPYRLGQTFTNVDSVPAGQGVLGSTFQPRQRRTIWRDAMGVTARSEVRPANGIVDEVGVGYTALGAVAGDKQQAEGNVSRTLFTSWNLSGAYIYRQPIYNAVPLLYQGTSSNPGALITSPRGPDDPFRVEWDNRKAHIGELTLVYDPTPATPFFKFTKNTLTDWNLNTEEDSPWTAALQYRMVQYLDNTDRMYYFDENNTLLFDPIFHAGALASDGVTHSGTAILHWKHHQWNLIASCSAGEALAGAAVAYTTSTAYYKPTTIYMQSMLSADNGVVKVFGSYARDVWGPHDYHAQLGWAYHYIYQAGISARFLRDFESGFRYVGTRMTDQFIGTDIGAFNEYRFYLSYHFSLEGNVGRRFEPIGRPIPLLLPEASLSLSDSRFTPDGSSPVKSINLYPKANASSGILSWHIHAKNSQGSIVKEWKGNGVPPNTLLWDGSGTDSKALPCGPYRLSLTVIDLNGNESTTPTQAAEIVCPVIPEPVSPAPKDFSVTATAEGLRVTLNSLVLFDTGKYDLKLGAKSTLDKVVEFLKAYPTNNIRISGHTDNRGSDTLNQKLSEQRAQAVADYLFRNGQISRSRLTAVGYGKRRPAASNATEDGRQLNRRVEIDILK